MGGELILGPQSTQMIQTPDITSADRCVSTEGLSGLPSPHASTCMRAHPPHSRATRQQSVRAAEGRLLYQGC